MNIRQILKIISKKVLYNKYTTVGSHCTATRKGFGQQSQQRPLLQLLDNDNNAARSFPEVVTRTGWTDWADGRGRTFRTCRTLLQRSALVCNLIERT